MSVDKVMITVKAEFTLVNEHFAGECNEPSMIQKYKYES
jgi:hypothetical protein